MSEQKEYHWKSLCRGMSNAIRMGQNAKKKLKIDSRGSDTCRVSCAYITEITGIGHITGQMSQSGKWS